MNVTYIHDSQDINSRHPNSFVTSQLATMHRQTIFHSNQHFLRGSIGIRLHVGLSGCSTTPWLQNDPWAMWSTQGLQKYVHFIMTGQQRNRLNIYCGKVLSDHIAQDRVKWMGHAYMTYRTYIWVIQWFSRCLTWSLHLITSISLMICKQVMCVKINSGKCGKFSINMGRAVLDSLGGWNKSFCSHCIFKRQMVTWRPTKIKKKAMVFIGSVQSSSSWPFDGIIQSMQLSKLIIAHKTKV